MKNFKESGLNKLNKKQFPFILKIIALITVNIFIFSNLSYSINKDLNNKLIRFLEENDPRSKGANEICMEFYKGSLFDLTGSKDTTLKISNNIFLKFCQNINNTKSSCIYKTNSNYIRLSGDINGEENNKNKIEILPLRDNNIKILFAAGDICKANNNTRYKVEIELRYGGSPIFGLDEKINFDPEINCTLNIKGYSNYVKEIENRYFYFGTFIQISLGIIFILMGLVIGIATYKTYRLCAYFVGVYGYYSLFFTFIDGSNFAFVADLFDELLLVFIFFGLLLPILLANKNNYKKIYIFFVGGICGYPISTMINNFIISFINITYKRFIFILILIICIIIGIILANYYPKQTCFIGSSIISSYLIVRGYLFSCRI